ncbi:MAG: hypothetical protein E7642_06690 [Ruminococcaceae bacterium]|nr:hypothetical protein [Oscillospiraceae bacterium]
MAQEEGDNGNVVTQLLVDPQGVDANMTATGMVALLHFSEDGKDVSVEYYSTIKEQYFMTRNQFSFTLDVVDVADDDTTTPPENNEDKEENKDENKDENNGGDKNEQNPKPTEKPTGKATDATTEPVGSTPAPTDAANEKSGCGSVIGTVALLPTIAFASALFVKKKKKY